MTATARVLPDGSVVVTDGPVTHQPLSPDAVQAVAAKAQASAGASQTQQLAEALVVLAGLLSEVGSGASATVTVSNGTALATVDQASYALAVQTFTDGHADGKGGWVAGPMTVTQASRTVTDGVTTAASTTVTSATANFNAYDRGRAISGGTLPSGTAINEVTDAQTVVVSNPAGADGTAVSLTIG